MNTSLPTDVVHLICKQMSGTDIARLACVGRDWKYDTRLSHPWLRKALVGHKEHGDVSNVPFFEYQDSLRSYEDVEFWSRVCVCTSSDHLRRSIQHQLKRREFSMRVSEVNNHNNNSLTREQQAVIDTEPRPGRVMAVQAYAGTGKTTTLVHYAQRWNRRILYLAYNKALTEDSQRRFSDLPHVHVMTIHAMALRALSLSGETFELAKGIKNTAYTDREIDEFEEYCSRSETTVPDNLRGIWDAMFVFKNIPVTHDAYLKAFQRTLPVLSDYDVIMLDEVQDCTDCVLDIVMRQTHATRIMVGDAYQKIYGFRHVNEAFQYIQQHQTHDLTLFRLSVSFRMGFTWMDYVNMYLTRMYHATGFTKSKRTHDTEICFFFKRQFNDRESVDRLPHGTVILCRYNINLIKLMFVFCEQNKRFRVYGKSFKCEKEIRLVDDLVHLMDNQSELVVHEKLQRFASIEELTEYYQRTNNHAWCTRLRLFHQYGPDALQRMWRTVQEQADQDVDLVITTAHQSKGCEFDNVVLYDDFSMNDPNILYVAMTRAKKRIYLNDYMYNFYKKVMTPHVYTGDTKQMSQFKTCLYCHRTKTNLMVCRENDHMGIIQHSKCEVYEYVPMCNICRHKHVA
jgi:F-box protein, helicase, 18